MTFEKAPRKVDIDPLYDNTKLNLIGITHGKDAYKSIVPYTVEQTYVKPNGDRQEFLEKTSTLSTMQRHLVFFDGDLDGVIWPSDTFKAFMILGYGFLLSCLSVLLIHGAFSYATGPTSGESFWHYLPDPFFRIYIANIQRCKHGTDTEVFNRRGDFQSERLDEIFQDYSTSTSKDSLSYADILAMIKGRRHLLDPIGILSEIFEFSSTFMLLWPKDGRIKRNDLEKVIDGSIFGTLANQRKGAFYEK